MVCWLEKGQAKVIYKNDFVCDLFVGSLKKAKKVK